MTETIELADPATCWVAGCEQPAQGELTLRYYRPGFRAGERFAPGTFLDYGQPLPYCGEHRTDRVAWWSGLSEPPRAWRWTVCRAWSEAVSA